MKQKDPQAPEEKGWFHLDVHPWVFFVSGGLIITFVALTLH